jgi:dynein heavy chain
MNSRPTTAYKKEKNFDLPFPELFDRSERTFAATFAKYGDLSYYTPV